jgi:hypothetical protein
MEDLDQAENSSDILQSKIKNRRNTSAAINNPLNGLGSMKKHPSLASLAISNTVDYRSPSVVI